MAQVTFEKDLSRHPLHYFTLLCVMLAGLWGLFWFSYKPAMQMCILISMAISFIVWGIVHHYEHKDLHIKIIMEYVLWAVMGILLFGSLLLRS